MKIIRTIIIILIAAFISGFVVNQMTIKKMHENELKNSVNAMLYDLSIELDLFELWQSKYKTDSTFERKIKHLIYNKIVPLSILKPDIRTLETVPLKALYDLGQLSKNKNFSFEKYEKAYKNSLDYLGSIELEVQNVLRERNRQGLPH